MDAETKRYIDQKLAQLEKKLLAAIKNQEPLLRLLAR
jgi:hypothetical protein